MFQVASLKGIFMVLFFTTRLHCACDAIRSNAIKLMLIFGFVMDTEVGLPCSLFIHCCQDQPPVVIFQTKHGKRANFDFLLAFFLFYSPQYATVVSQKSLSTSKTLTLAQGRSFLGNLFYKHILQF